MSAAATLRRERVAAGLTQEELAKRAGTSQPAVNRYERGVVTPRVDTFERLLHVCANAGRPRPLLGPIGYLVAARREEILRIADNNGAHNVRVFGSVARREDRPNSDLDLLVDFDDGRSLLDLAGLTEELSDALGIAVDVATEDILKPAVAAAARAEAVLL